jgi:hypothetical protein
MSLRARLVFFTSRMATTPRMRRRHAQTSDPMLKSTTVFVPPDVASGVSTSAGSTPMTSAAQNRLRANQPG